MARDEHGRFLPGESGNPYGRPRKVEPDMFEDTDRTAFFEIDNEEIPVGLNGRPVKMTTRKAIDKRMALAAAGGNIRAAIEWTKRRDRYISKVAKETGETIEQLVKSIEVVQNSPEDVTDDYLNALKSSLENLHPRLKWLFQDIRLLN